ncbi:MAG: preprotein translocase subunit SecE [Dehalococcoidia bacterium]|nr:preprotein translocase subunit SecE [Dehalococcoidia bacterium]
MTSHIRKASDARSAPAKKSRFSFFAEVVPELRKAHWPSRQEALRLSVLVLIVCATVGAILGALDYGFFRLFADLLLGG